MFINLFLKLCSAFFVHFVAKRKNNHKEHQVLKKFTKNEYLNSSGLAGIISNSRKFSEGVSKSKNETRNHRAALANSRRTRILTDNKK